MENRRVCELCGGVNVVRQTFVVRSWCPPEAPCGGAEHWACGACRRDYRLDAPYRPGRRPKHRSWFRECPAPVADALRVARELMGDG